MHPYITYELHRQWVAELERKAELRRQFPRRQRRRLKLFGVRLPKFRRRARLVAQAAAKARPCP